jgi:hypothetical protein
MRLVQSESGHLRRQHNTFLDDDIPTSGEFAVNEAVFSEFLDLVCDGPQVA